MTGISNEFKVGLFVLVALVLVIGSYLWSFDGVRKDEASYVIYMSVGSADGVYQGTAVRLAGIEIGSVDGVEIAGDHADLALRIRDEYQLPIDTEGALKASGLLGDLFVRIYPGTSDSLVPDGGRIRSRAEPGDIDTITRNLELISDDIKSITGILREVVENRDNRDHVEATLANVDALSLELRLLAERNRGDIDAIVDSVRRLSEALERYTADIAADVDDEFERIRDLTDDLDRAAEDVASITGKIDRGEGTIGALVNDDETIDQLNDTIGEVNSAVRSFFGLRPELYYIGRFYLGTQPADTALFPTGNELAGAGSNTIGIKMKSSKDFWYLIEFVDHPQGNVTQREIYREATNTFETRWTRERGFKFTFQVEKRWGVASFRIGLRESGGGAGVTFYALRDRLQIGADVFSFRFGSYPAVGESGIPNSRVFIRYEPVRNFFIEGGAEQVILGAKNGFFTGYLGLGFHFRDNNLRAILTTIPAAL